MLQDVDSGEDVLVVAGGGEAQSMTAAWSDSDSLRMSRTGHTQ